MTCVQMPMKSQSTKRYWATTGGLNERTSHRWKKKGKAPGPHLLFFHLFFSFNLAQDQSLCFCHFCFSGEECWFVFCQECRSPANICSCWTQRSPMFPFWKARHGDQKQSIMIKYLVCKIIEWFKQKPTQLSMQTSWDNLDIIGPFMHCTSIHGCRRSGWVDTFLTALASLSKLCMVNAAKFQFPRQYRAWVLFVSVVAHFEVEMTLGRCTPTRWRGRMSFFSSWRLRLSACGTGASWRFRYDIRPVGDSPGVVIPEEEWQEQCAEWLAGRKQQKAARLAQVFLLQVTLFSFSTAFHSQSF